MTEQFIEQEEGMVKYVRTVNLVDGRTADVEVMLTRAYLQQTDQPVIERYLDVAVAGVLTRQGVQANAD